MYLHVSIFINKKETTTYQIFLVFLLIGKHFIV